MAITIKDCTVSNCQTAVHASGPHNIKIDGLKVHNTKTVLNIDSEVNLDAKNVTAKEIGTFLRARPTIPVELAQAMLRDIKNGSNAGEIVEKYSDRLQGYGVKLDTLLTWGERTVRGAELITSITRLFGMG